jgi:hypothetical protein
MTPWVASGVNCSASDWLAMNEPRSCPFDRLSSHSGRTLVVRWRDRLVWELRCDRSVLGEIDLGRSRLRGAAGEWQLELARRAIVARSDSPHEAPAALYPNRVRAGGERAISDEISLAVSLNAFTDRIRVKTATGVMCTVSLSRSSPRRRGAPMELLVDLELPRSTKRPRFSPR